MNTTTEGHIVIQRSVSKLIGAVAIGAAFVAIGVWVIKGDADPRYGAATVYLGWLVTVFFGLVLLAIIHRLIFGHHKPVELSPQGFLDKRAVTQEVPWSAVARISVWSVRGTSLLRIESADEAMQHNILTPIGLTTTWLNRRLRLDGIYVGSADLNTSFSELRMLFQKYLSDYNSTAIDDTK